eukprot:1919434-Rhodomonas_salina.1
MSDVTKLETEIAQLKAELEKVKRQKGGIDETSSRPAGKPSTHARETCVRPGTEKLYDGVPEVQNPLPALLHDSILTTVGKTPLVKLQKMAPEASTPTRRAELTQHVSRSGTDT